MIALETGDPLALLGTPSAPRTSAKRVKAVKAPKSVVKKFKLEYAFDNGKQLIISEKNPHLGAFKVLITKKDLQQFSPAIIANLHVGQVVEVSGTMGWYQGDPVIRVTNPQQIVFPAFAKGMQKNRQNRIR